MTLRREWKSPDVRKKASSYVARYGKKSFEKRKAEEKDREAAQDIERRMKDDFKARRETMTKKRVAKAERKKANEIQMGNVQVIKNTAKLRKYDRKALAKVIKMSAEQIEQLASRK